MSFVDGWCYRLSAHYSATNRRVGNLLTYAWELTTSMPTMERLVTARLKEMQKASDDEHKKKKESLDPAEDVEMTENETEPHPLIKVEDHFDADFIADMMEEETADKVIARRLPVRSPASKMYCKLVRVTQDEDDDDQKEIEYIAEPQKCDHKMDPVLICRLCKPENGSWGWQRDWVYTVGSGTFVVSMSPYVKHLKKVHPTSLGVLGSKLSNTSTLRCLHVV